MYTLNGFNKRIENLLENSNFDEVTADALKELVEERREVDEVIRKRATGYPDEGEVFEYEEERSSGEDWEARYNDLKQKYTSRFFDSGSTIVGANANPIKDDEDIAMDDRKTVEELSGIDDLFERRD